MHLSAMKLTIILLISVNFIAVINGNGKTLFCYWGSWSTYRWGDGGLTPKQINGNICTHLLYAFAGLNHRDQIDSLDPWNDLPSHAAGGGKDNYRNLVALKRNNPKLKVLISIGGWNEGSIKFSKLVFSEPSRKTFVSSVINFLDRYGFDGLDFAWQWPGQRGGLYHDKQYYVLLLKELNNAFKPKNYTLSIAAPAIFNEVGFNLPEIMKYVNFVTIYAYDYYVSDITLQHGSPLYNQQYPRNSVNNSVQDYLDHGAMAEKLLLGVTVYGRSYKLLDSQQTTIGDPNNGPGEPGPYTQTRGLLAWFELCSKMKNTQFTEINDDNAKVTYAFNNYEWIGYESNYSLSEKVVYAKDNKLAGITIWSLDNDDNNQLCGQSLSSIVSKALL